MDWALLAVSTALLLATVGYVFYTAQMLKEMRAARLLGIRPMLSLDVGIRTHQRGELVLTNVGQGTALDIDVTLEFRPGGEIRQWKAYSLPPREDAHFIPASPIGDDTGYPTFQELASPNRLRESQWLDARHRRWRASGGRTGRVQPMVGGAGRSASSPPEEDFRKDRY